VVLKTAEISFQEGGIQLRSNPEWKSALPKGGRNRMSLLSPVKRHFVIDVGRGGVGSPKPLLCGGGAGQGKEFAF